jgi:hypothetical protein
MSMLTTSLPLPRVALPAPIAFVASSSTRPIDETFRPNDSSDPDGRREIISLKKLLKGDACWSTLKVVLGWLIDSDKEYRRIP